MQSVALATLIGTVIGTAMSVVVGRILIDPRIQQIERKIETLIDVVIGGQKPPPA